MRSKLQCLETLAQSGKTHEGLNMIRSADNGLPSDGFSACILSSKLFGSGSQVTGYCMGGSGLGSLTVSSLSQSTPETFIKSANSSQLGLKSFPYTTLSNYDHPIQIY